MFFKFEFQIKEYPLQFEFQRSELAKKSEFLKWGIWEQKKVWILKEKNIKNAKFEFQWSELSTSQFLKIRIWKQKECTYSKVQGLKEK